VITDLSRDEILRRFTEFLDRALATEEAPAGIDQELLSAVLGGEEARVDGCDSYALWSAMTALTQEVKLQGRSFKELSEAVTAQPARVGEEMRNAWKDRERELQRATEYRCRKDALGVLIDLRDRMVRGMEAVRGGEAELARRAKSGWFARMFGQGDGVAADVLSALKKGYELSIDRLDQALAEMNAREIRCQGEQFDPRRMNAIDREVSQTEPEGAVLEVYRSGYEWNGEVFRPAQVKVACAPVAGREI
jgi:molecular chaperone GrpE (heat shock protein)